MAPMLRNYKVFACHYRFRMQIRESTGGGETEFVGWETSLSDHVFRVLATDMSAAEWYARKRNKYLKDFEYVKTEEVCNINGAVWEEGA